MSDVTDQDLSRWEVLSDKATRGPWEWDDHNDRICAEGAEGVGADTVVGGGSVGYENAQLNIGRADADFIVAARAAVPALIAEVRRLRQLLDLDAEAP